MATVAEAFVTLRPDLKDFEKETKSGMSGLGGIAKTAALGVAALGTAFAGVATIAVKAAIEEEAGIKRLSQAVIANGGDWASLGSTIEGQIGKWERLTAFSDGEMRDSLSNLTNMTGSAEEAMKRLPIAMDLARGTGMSLEGASRLLGKVTDENTQVFKKFGIEIAKGATETQVLQEVQRVFAGQSEAYAKTAAGQWATLTNNLDNLKEDLGSALLPLFIGVAGLATNAVDKLRQGWEDLGPVFEQVKGWFQNAGVVLLGIWNSKPVQSFVTAVFTELKKVPGFVAQVAGAIGEMFEVLSGRGRPDAGGVLASLVGQDTASGIQGTLASVRDAFREAFDVLGPIVQVVIDKVVDLKAKFDELPPALKTFAGALVVGEVTGFNDAVVGTAASVATMASGIINVGEVIAGKGGVGKIIEGLGQSLKGLLAPLVAPIAVMAAVVLSIWAVIEVVKTVILIIENWDKVLFLLGKAFEGPMRVLGDFRLKVEGFFAPVRQWLDLFEKDAPYALGVLLGAFISIGPSIVSAVFGMLTEVGTRFVVWRDDMLKTVREAFGGFLAAIPDFVKRAIPAIAKFVVEFAMEFEALKTRLADAAWNAVQGFIGGILGAIPDVVQAAVNFAGRFLQGMKDALGIKSPSRATEAMGEMLLQGLERGLDRRVDLGGLADLSGVSLPGINGHLTGGAGNAQPIVVQLDGRVLMEVVAERTQQHSFLVGGALG